MPPSGPYAPAAVRERAKAFVKRRGRRLTQREGTEPGTESVRRHAGVRLAASAGAVLVLSVIGPFGTFSDLGFWPRLAYWGGLVACGLAVTELLRRLLLPLCVRLDVRWPYALAALFAGLTAVQTLAVAGVERLVRGYDFLTPAGFAELFLYVGTITALIAAMPAWLELRGRGLLGPPAAPPSLPAAGPAEDGGDSDRQPRFLDRLPAKLGRELLALEMEDHYVRVHTPLGSDLLLLRMRDAVAELDGLPGCLVHRSYWVAAAAVAQVQRRADGRMTLVLTNGLRVPVSRARAAAVRAALARRPLRRTEAGRSDPQQ